MIVGLPKLPAVCDTCGHRVPSHRITRRCYDVLRDDYHHRHFAHELEMLIKVVNFYRRNPGARNSIQPHAIRVLQSRDPKVRERVQQNVPLCDIELPPAPDPPLTVRHPDDAEVIHYLRHHSFNLSLRLPWVTEQCERTRESIDKVRCPRCKTGHMHLVPRTGAHDHPTLP